jgi:PAT family beta-lactamase induction signal transducer AmpG
VTDAWLLWTLVACSVIALAAATHDVAADGLYLVGLDAADQARFVGVRNACFRLGRLFVLGFVVWLAGVLERERGVIATAWRDAFLAAAGVYFAGFLLCAWLLPRPAADRPIAHRDASGAPPFVAQLVAYVRQPRIGVVVAFIFLYRAGESLLMPMLSPFLLEERAKGGLGLTTDQQGLAYGTLGVLALVAGGLAGGWLLGRLGLRRCLWPMALTMHAPNLLLLWAAHAQPPAAVVFAIVGVEQLAYGFGFSAYMVFLMQISRGSEYSTSHYAISTGLMGLAAMLAGLWSGDLVEALGFEGFFLAVTLAALPGLAVLPFVTWDEDAPPR